MLTPGRPWHTRRVPSAPRHEHDQPPRPAPRPAARALLASALVAGAVVATIGCGAEGADAERFCGEIATRPEAVVSPTIASEDDLDEVLAHYRMLADLAPLAIAEEWQALVTNLETASTVVPSDDESLQRALAQAYATERSAVEVQRWLAANCSIDLGPVATIVPHDPVVPAVDWPDEADRTDDVDGVDGVDAGDGADEPAP